MTEKPICGICGKAIRDGSTYHIETDSVGRKFIFDSCCHIDWLQMPHYFKCTVCDWKDIAKMIRDVCPPCPRCGNKTVLVGERVIKVPPDSTMDAEDGTTLLKEWIAWLDKRYCRIHEFISGEVGWSGISDAKVNDLIVEFIDAKVAATPEMQ
jgi:predicted RNA-binding Zn-ribbon protein involved in translation (DUF1610 family)